MQTIQYYPVVAWGKTNLHYADPESSGAMPIRQLLGKDTMNPRQLVLFAQLGVQFTQVVSPINA